MATPSKTLIDTSVLVAAERAGLQLRDLLATHGEQEAAIAAITAAELLHGVHRAVRSTTRSRRKTYVEALLTSLPVIPFDLELARLHARLWAELAGKGIVIGAHDLLIAATALATGSVLATRDERSFRRIPGLRVVVW